jgi:predicted HTH transcriptional regulator
MKKRLSMDEIKKILKDNPEQNIFDWKQNLNFGESKEKNSDIIKDIVAIANSITDEPGYIFYGVDPQQDNPLLEISIPDVDSQLQQLVKDKVEPEVKFLFYTVDHQNGKMGIIHIEPDYKKPHIISKDYGKLRDGQIPIRIGSSTRGIRSQDLVDIFYDPRNPLFKERLNIVDSYAKIAQAAPQLLKQLKVEEDEIDKEAKRRLGLQ